MSTTPPTEQRYLISASQLEMVRQFAVKADSLSLYMVANQCFMDGPFKEPQTPKKGRPAGSKNKTKTDAAKEVAESQRKEGDESDSESSAPHLQGDLGMPGNGLANDSDVPVAL